jgi:hypothetical protein
MKTFSFKSRRSPVYGNRGAVATTQVFYTSKHSQSDPAFYLDIDNHFFKEYLSFFIAIGKSDWLEYLAERRELLWCSNCCSSSSECYRTYFNRLNKIFVFLIRNPILTIFICSLFRYWRWLFYDIFWCKNRKSSWS